jgi:hypothetical protein
MTTTRKLPQSAYPFRKLILGYPVGTVGGSFTVPLITDADHARVRRAVAEGAKILRQWTVHQDFNGNLYTVNIDTDTPV